MVFMVWVGDNDMIIDEGVTKKKKNTTDTFSDFGCQKWDIFVIFQIVHHYCNQHYPYPYKSSRPV